MRSFLFADSASLVLTSCRVTQRQEIKVEIGMADASDLSKREPFRLCKSNTERAESVSHVETERDGDREEEREE